ADRLHVDVSADPRLADRVADNLFSPSKFDGTESESLLIGKGFGTTPDIEQGPDGNLYVVSVTDNVIYKISRVGVQTAGIESFGLPGDGTIQADAPPGGPDSTAVPTTFVLDQIMAAGGVIRFSDFQLLAAAQGGGTI